MLSSAESDDISLPVFPSIINVLYIYVHIPYKSHEWGQSSHLKKGIRTTYLITFDIINDSRCTFSEAHEVMLRHATQ